MCDWHLSSAPGDGPQRDQAAAAVIGSTAFVFGGRDMGGAATNTLLALDLSDPCASWASLPPSSGKPPPPRWGASCFAWGDQLWVVGGTTGGGKRLGDVWRFDPLMHAWAEAGAPRRAWAAAGGFDRVAVVGGALVAFGEPQDENRDPTHRPGKPAAGPGPLALHALDLLTGTWAELPCAGAPGFDHLEALAPAGGRLVAVGWQAPRGGQKEDVPMQVATLDVASALTMVSARAAAWTKLPVRGHVPTARTGCASALLAEGGRGVGGGRGMTQLLVHGGVLCSPSVQGLITSDAYALDLDTCTWTKLAPIASRAFGNGALSQPRINHCAVALPQGAGMLVLGGTSSLGCFASCPTAELLCRAPPAAAHRAPPPASADGAPAPASAGALAPRHDLRSFYLSEALSDVLLAAGDAQLPAHRLVLAASPRFRELMEQSAAYTKPADRKWKIHLSDMWPDILKLLLAHMYGCLDAVPQADAATLYGLPALRDECLRVLCATTTVESMSMHVLLAYEHQSSELMQACVSFAAASQERLAQMLASPGYLHLTEASPKVSQIFLNQAMQELLRQR
ncbi:MAG: hypothetical protein J3K34DRAFT_526059 [Monoraphidium minutum]|nr:MAG: hypothetical protein J3K34DRAFT_526059 [Monoraphidium minutum]